MVFHVSLPSWKCSCGRPRKAKTFRAPLLCHIWLLIPNCDFIAAATPNPPPSSQSWTQSFEVSEGRQAGNNWLKVTSSGLRGRLGLHLPPECLPFLPLLLGSSCRVPGAHERRLCWVSWQPGSIGFGYQSESILKDDCLSGGSHGQTESEELRGLWSWNAL